VPPPTDGVVDGSQGVNAVFRHPGPGEGAWTNFRTGPSLLVSWSRFLRPFCFSPECLLNNRRMTSMLALILFLKVRHRPSHRTLASRDYRSNEPDWRPKGFPFPPKQKVVLMAFFESFGSLLCRVVPTFFARYCPVVTSRLNDSNAFFFLSFHRSDCLPFRLDGDVW